MEKDGMISEMNDNGARAVLLGCACVVRSLLTPEEIERFIIYHPEYLHLEDDRGQTVFSIDLDDGSGCITRERAVYSRVKTADGKATITVLFDPEVEDRRGRFLETVGPALGLLDEMETRLLALLPELAEDERKAWSMISQM